MNQPGIASTLRTVCFTCFQSRRLLTVDSILPVTLASSTPPTLKNSIPAAKPQRLIQSVPDLRSFFFFFFSFSLFICFPGRLIDPRADLLQSSRPKRHQMGFRSLPRDEQTSAAVTVCVQLRGCARSYALRRRVTAAASHSSHQVPRDSFTLHWICNKRLSGG